MSMKDDDNGEQNYHFNAFVTKDKIAAMDRKRINTVYKIASSFANFTSSLRDPKTNSQKLSHMWGI